MKNKVKSFKNNEFGEIRTIFKDGDVWFVVKDISKILDYCDTNALTRRLDADELESYTDNSSDQGRTIVIVNESGLYNAIMGSKKPEAKKFKKWVTNEVLPPIRKHGGYLASQKIEEALLNPDVLIKLATDLKIEREKRKILEVQVKENKPFVNFAKHVTESSDRVDIETFSKIIHDEDIRFGRNKLFNFLRDEKLLMKNNIPYQKYIDNEIFEVIESNYKTPYGVKIATKTLITGKGQVYLIELLKDKLGFSGNL